MTKKIPLLLCAIATISVLYAIFKLSSLWKNVDRYQAYWQARARKYDQKDAFLYIALGDSTAQGIGASKPEKGYVGLVASYLEASKKLPVRVVNLSVSGAKIEDVLKGQIPLLSDYTSPDLITIQVGANDIKGFDKDTFRKSLKKLIGSLPDSTVMSNVPSFKNGRLYRNSGTAECASQIADELLQDSGLTSVDLYSVTNNEIGFFDTAADFFHPNDAAYEKWAEVFIAGYAKKMSVADRSLK